MSGQAKTTVIVGGGVNALVAALILARKQGEGRKIVVLEKRERLGGLAAGEEFAKGYFTAGTLHDASLLGEDLERELKLSKFGLERSPTAPAVLVTSGVQAEEGIVLHALHAGDGVDEPELTEHAEDDLKSWRDFNAQLERWRAPLRGLLTRAPADPDTAKATGFLDLARSGFTLRRLGGKDLTEFLRVAPMCVADWLNETFRSDLLKSGLALEALTGCWAGPWSPGTATNMILRAAARERTIQGGPAALVRALEGACRAESSIELRVETEVSRLLVERGQIRGVQTRAVETVDADEVLLTTDPKRSLLDLVDPRQLPAELSKRLSVIRTRGVTAKVHLALREPLTFACRPKRSFDRIRVPAGPHLDDHERAFDAIKYGEMSKTPLLDISQPSIHSQELCPEGHAVASVLVHYAPHELEGGWTDEAREKLQERVLARLDEVAPGTRSNLIAAETLTPVDLEERFGLSGGHVFHGEEALDQLLFMRPTPGLARYETPIAGLFLGGSGSHPGGGVRGTPGQLGARALLAARR